MKRFLVVLLCVLTKITTFSQAVDTTLWTPNGPVNAILLKDSLLYIGGDFDQVSPVTGNFVALDSVTAEVSAPFPFITGKINCMVRDSLGYVYVGGLFSKVGATSCFNLFRLTPQGNFDPTFLPNPDGEVFELMISWNTLYVGGNFGSIDGLSRGRGAAIFLANDSLTPFDPASNGPIYAFCADTLNRQLIVGGDFLYIGGGVIANLGKLNRDFGSYIPYGNSVWTAQPQVFGPVKDIVVYHNKIYVAGDFNAFASVISPGIGALSLSSGLVLTQFNAGLNGFVQDVDLINDKLYICGNFTSSHTATRNGLACLDTSLNLLSWNPSANGDVNDIAISNDSSAFYIAGSFHKLGSDTIYNAGMALCDSLGTVVLWNPKFNAEARAIIPATLPGKIWVGGDFTGAGGVLRENLCAININTKTANSWNPKVNLPVTTLCADNSQLFVSGDFTNINGQSRNRLASFDLSTLTLTNFNPGVNGLVRTMVSDNVNLFLGGNFSNVGGQNRSNIASVTISSVTTTPWNPGCAGTVNKLLLDGNHVYVAGFFTQCGGQFRDNMARLDKSTGLAEWSWSCNTDDGVYDIDLYNGQLYMGGWFHNVAGQGRNFLAAADTVSGNLLSFNPSAGNFIRCFTRWNDDLFMSGPFVFVGQSLNHPHLCNYDLGDGIFDTWTPSPDIFPVTMQASQNQLFIGGTFSHIGYRFSPNLCLLDIMWVTEIPENSSSFSALKIWPVPSGDYVNIRIPNGRSNNTILQLLDVNGKIVREEFVSTGIETFVIDIHGLAQGMYTLRMRDNEGKESSARIIKQ